MRVTCVCVCVPGGWVQFIVEQAASVVAFSAADGAITQLYLATSPEVESANIRGKYYVPLADPKSPSAFAHNDTVVNQLMEWTFATLEHAGYPIPAHLQATVRV